jgi:hypothetical protein
LFNHQLQHLKVVKIDKYVSINVYREIGYLLTFAYFLVGWHAGAVSLPPGEVIFVELACPIHDAIFCLNRG